MLTRSPMNRPYWLVKDKSVKQKEMANLIEAPEKTVTASVETSNNTEAVNNNFSIWFYLLIVLGLVATTATILLSSTEDDEIEELMRAPAGWETPENENVISLLLKCGLDTANYSKRYHHLFLIPSGMTDAQLLMVSAEIQALDKKIVQEKKCRLTGSLGTPYILYPCAESEDFITNIVGGMPVRQYLPEEKLKIKKILQERFSHRRFLAFEGFLSNGHIAILHAHGFRQVLAKSAGMLGNGLWCNDSFAFPFDESIFNFM